MHFALKIENLCKTFGKGKEVLHNISLEVKAHSFFALLGANGAGKSTIIGIITSLISKTSGTVNIFGYNIDTKTALAKKHVGLVPQEFNFNQFESPQEILFNQAGYYGFSRREISGRVREYLERFELYVYRDQESRTLSGGMKRRLMIARALLHQPKLLILDEPTAGIDIELRKKIWDLLIDLNREGITIILTTHYLEEAEHLCREIAIIKDGKTVIDTTMKQLLARLQIESFTLYTQCPISTLPQIENALVEEKDPTEIEVTLYNKKPMHEVLNELSRCGIKISSLRNSSNRLERLFLDIVKTGSHTWK